MIFLKLKIKKLYMTYMTQIGNNVSFICYYVVKKE